MIREIKFRFWDGEFMREDFDGWSDDVSTNTHFRCFEEWGIVVMQYTGLKDRNGADIWEGDVIKFHYFYGALGDNDGFVECEHELTGVVKWGEFGWALESIKGEHWKGHTGYEHGEGGAYLVELAAMNEGAIHEESFEVIGNIYQHPELLNK